MPKISVPQKNLVLEANGAENLMFFLQAKGVPVASSCLGDGICGKCRMKVTGALPEATALEEETSKRNKITEDQRLACQIEIQSDLVVETTYW
jgi:ferredoxin, 2Fe-2S